MRFTKKSDKLGYCLRHSSIKTWQCWDKLGQLEDIEEEYAIQNTTDLRRRLDLADKYAELSDQLGIDLITLFKAMKNGFWCVDSLSQLPQEIGANATDLSILDKELKVYDEDGWVYAEFYLKDYGKTWSLDKKELTKEELKK